MQLGAGFDIMTGQVKPPCVSFSQVSLPAPSADLVAAPVTSSAQIMQLFGARGTDVFTGSTSMELQALNSWRIAHYTVNHAAVLTVGKTWAMAYNETMARDYQQMAKTQPAQFRQACGDRFVRGILLGGELVGLTQFVPSSEAEFVQFAAKPGDSLSAVRGSTPPTPRRIAAASYTYPALMTSVNCMATGGSSGACVAKSGNPVFDMASLQGQLKAKLEGGFASDVQSTSSNAPVLVILAEYPQVTLPAGPGGSVNPFALLKWDYVSVRSAIDHVRLLPGAFRMDPAARTAWDSALQALRVETEQAIASVTTAAQACILNAASCSVPQGMRKPSDILANLPPRFGTTCPYRLQLLETGKGLNDYPAPSFASPLPSWVSARNSLVQKVLNLANQNKSADTDVGGYPIEIQIRSEIELADPMDPTVEAATQSGKVIRIRTGVGIGEEGGDHSALGGHIRVNYVDVSGSSGGMFPGCYVGGPASPTIQPEQDVSYNRAWLRAPQNTRNHNWTLYSPPNSTDYLRPDSKGGFINQAYCLPDTDGDDLGKLGCWVAFRPQPVVVRHEEERAAYHRRPVSLSPPVTTPLSSGFLAVQPRWQTAYASALTALDLKRSGMATKALEQLKAQTGAPLNTNVTVPPR